MEEGFAKRFEGNAGIKYLHNGSYELKINNSDNRLIANKAYKNLQGENLIIFRDEKCHAQVNDITEFNIYNDDNLGVAIIGVIN